MNGRKKHGNEIDFEDDKLFTSKSESMYSQITTKHKRERKKETADSLIISKFCSQIM
jgi:hypothetical protein